MNKPIPRTIQATGYLPIAIDEIGRFHTEVAVDNKRSVRCEILIATKGCVYVVMTYMTTWDDELDYCRIAADVQDVAAAGRQLCIDLLPRGYGYPATPEYAARQKKLEGQVDMAALHALTRTLEEYFETWVSHPDTQSS